MNVVLVEENAEILQQLLESVSQQNPYAAITVKNIGQPLPTQKDVLVVQHKFLPKVLPEITTEQKNFSLRYTQIGANQYCVMIFSNIGQNFTLHPTAHNVTSVDNCLEQIFNIIGIKRNLLGTQYLRDAVRLIVPNPQQYNKKFTTKLYPDIAKIHGSTPAKIERSIRHCIEVCYNNGHLEKLNSVFQCNVIDKVYKPSNGELISFIAEQILYRLSNVQSAM